MRKVGFLKHYIITRNLIHDYVYLGLLIATFHFFTAQYGGQDCPKAPQWKLQNPYLHERIKQRENEPSLNPLSLLAVSQRMWKLEIFKLQNILEFKGINFHETYLIVSEIEICIKWNFNVLQLSQSSLPKSAGNFLLKI